MVFGWLAALAMDTICHVAGESPVVYAEKEFERFMKSYEFAIEAQKLKREDVKDLVELIVSRMDMYHLVGALLLEFCIAFYGQFKLLEEGYNEEPDFILEIFLLCNICAIGYLLFAVWLSLHASVAAHAIGVEFLLESSRLTIPSPENLRQMRESTSVFRHIYSMFADPVRQGARPPGQAQVSTLRPSMAEHEFENERTIVPVGEVQDDNATEHIHGQGQQLMLGPGKMPLALDSALDTMEHRHRFAESHRCWLRFDAYSRVCMALGINQMLQALSYFIVGPVQQKRPSSALLSLIAVQAIALLLLKLDLRNTEAETTPENGRDTDNESDAGSEISKSSNAAFMEIGSKDVSAASSRDLLLTLSTYTLAPLWTTLALWTNRFTKHAQLLSVSVTPCFFLHAMWLFLVLRTISPSHGDLLPARLRTVGYLDIFTKDVLNPDEWEEDATGQKRKKSNGRSDRSGGSSPESRRPLRTFSVTFEKAQAEGMAKALAKEGKKTNHHATRSAESVPWLVVKRFTITAIVMWIVGGIVHLAHTIYPNIEEYAKDLEEDAKDEQEELRGRLRRLQAVWPEPAGFFEVSAIHCNNSHVAFSSPFALLTAQRLEGGSSLGPLAESGSADTHSMMCRDGGCHTLVPNNDGPSGGDRSWHLQPVGETAGAAPETVPVPKEWRVAAAAWLPCGGRQRCDSALLAGWDGERIVISDMQQESDGLWSLDYRFAIRPGMGRERNCSPPRASFFGSWGGGHCNATELRDYEGVQAMQLSVSSTCQTLAVLLRNGTLDGWDLAAGTKLGTWRINSTLHTTMCHDGRDVFLTHPGDDSGPVVETIPLPAPLANCSAARRTEHDAIDINIATKHMFSEQASVDSLLQL